MLALDSLESVSTGETSTRTSEDYIETFITIPPDGGWGWIVVLGSFLCNFVVDGAIYTFGIFLIDISNTFHCEPTTVAEANSVMTGICLCSGPIVCALVNRLGFQLTGLIGGLIAASGFVFSTFTKSVSAFLLVYGIVGGFGFGLVYLPSVVVIGFYFERWRALATSIAVTGSAAGMIGFPLLMEGPLSKTTWQIRFQIISGFCVVVGALAVLYLPLKPTRVLTTKDKTIVQFISSYHHEAKPGFFQKIYNRFHNVKHPTHARISQINKASTFVMYAPPGPSTSSIFIVSIPEPERPESSMTTFFNTEGRSERFDKLSTLYEIEASRREQVSWNTCLRCKCCKWNCVRQKGNRPMYRDDIFYGGSLFTLPEYSQSIASQMIKRKSADYTLSVTRVEWLKEQDEKVYFKCCPESVIRTLVTMLHFHLLKSPVFLLLALSGIFTTLGMFIPFIYLIERANEVNISKELSYHFYTAVGLSNAVGRVLSGIISSTPKAKPLMISYVSLLICGLSTLISYFLKDVISHFVYVSVFGLTLACFSSLRTPIVVELLGLENLTNAFGLLLLFHGAAAFAGVPLAGKIVTLTKSFNKGFLFAGGVITLSAFLLMPIKRVSNWTRKVS